MQRQFTATSYILKDKKVLLVHHAKFDKWMPPGGHLEANETFVEAAKREAFEETGLEIELIDDAPPLKSQEVESMPRPFLSLLENIPATPKEPAHQHVDMIFLARPIGGSLDERAEKSAVRWFTWEEITSLPDEAIFADVRSTLRKLLNSPLPEKFTSR
ncbi:MAG: putative (di)nucleoside polyphosphate hydrolase [Chlamydiales bacterium]|jgi:ADP-ribose pyrophosphatase YjhB (NUDIX family)|nr:putative (di)nucleoside polyphosphate hydrolase [Chlamydiales bacterium]